MPPRPHPRAVSARGRQFGENRWRARQWTEESRACVQLVSLVLCGPSDSAAGDEAAWGDLSALPARARPYLLIKTANKARAILSKGGDRAYERALRVLLPDTREWWEGYVEDEEYAADATGLAAFIDEHVTAFVLEQEKEARHHDAIVNQTLGEGLQAYKLEKLSRYETHLDRKFERTLAMLIKLKDLRNNKNALKAD